MRSALNADRTVQLNAVLMPTNLAKFVDLVRLAADIGVDRMWVQALFHDFGDTAGGDEAYVAIRNFAAAQAVWSNGGLVPPALDEARRVARERGLDLRLPEQGPNQARQLRSPPMTYRATGHGPAPTSPTAEWCNPAAW